ncbi:MAG TPA: hypothetical protein VNV42_06490 [Solirubrobacteraceae bacterium]|nr:hypothetical protein [Solirubrobacteraceae bacterium]
MAGLSGTLLIVMLATSGRVAVAMASCSNEGLREQQSYAQVLPDCRAYEQVTPIGKNGVSPQLDQPEASPSGDALTFYSVLPFPVPSMGGSQYPDYLATRQAGGWATESVLAPTETEGEVVVRDWDEDLSSFAEQVYEADLPGAGERSTELYARDSATGEYRRVADAGSSEVHVDAVTPGGSHLLFETAAALPVPGAAEGVPNVYEWSSETGQLSLMGVLPVSEGGKAPPEGSIAGPSAWLEGRVSEPGEQGAYYAQNVISADGARVFWTDAGTDKLYVYEDGASSLVGAVHFDAANASGSRLLADDGSELVEYAIAHGSSGPVVTPAVIAPSASGIMGVLGMSENGSYVYFVANAVLAAHEGANGSHASTGSCLATSAGNGVKATCNLYLWHDGETMFIAPLQTNDEPVTASDWYDWAPTSKIGSGPEHVKSSRVSSDGTVMLFSSNLNQTGYDGRGHAELYRYEAPSGVHPNGSVVCVSCDPAGVSPKVEAAQQTPEEVEQETTVFALSPSAFAPEAVPSFLTRNLSADGTRVFFDSSEVLLPQDIAERGVRNVYEWESSGASSCTESSPSYSAQDGGCLYLLSTGQSPEPSYFVDASASGDDVFIDTSQRLVAQDGDELYDIYDARVGGGIAAQSERPKTCGGEECRPPVSSSPAFQMPISQSFAGAGNLVLPAQETKPMSKPKAKPPKPVSKPKAKPPTRAQQRAKALARCRKRYQRSKERRHACEASAKRRYANATGSATSTHREGRGGR